MNTKISIILLLISLALLIIYGTDVAYSNSGPVKSHQGFLKISEAIRGSVFGGGAVILSIIAFAISFKAKSNLVIMLLIINGGIIVAGISAVALQSSGEISRSTMMTIYGTIGLGILLIGLGIIKFVYCKNRLANKI